MYSLQKIISGHSNSVTSVAFSQDGRLCATGDEDGLVRIFAEDFKREEWRFNCAAEITCVVWHDVFKNFMLVGTSNGDVHLVQLGRKWLLFARSPSVRTSK
jgi:WD40 repeat protein